MIKKNIFFAAAASLILTFNSCSDSLDDINKNPNATEDPNPAYLLTGTLKHGADLYWGSSNNYNTSLLFVQHWASIQYTESDRYDVSNSTFTSLWNTGYASLITDLNTVLDLPDENANSNYKGIALTIRSWVFLLLTDAYGDIPYDEVGSSVTPRYDKQEYVYNALLNDLQQAQSLLDVSNGRIEGDVSFNGDINKWKKLVNSLRLRISLRIADRSPDLARQTISAARGEATGFISSNDEIFQFVYTSSPQHNPFAASFDTRDDYRVSKTLIDKLKELSDPRLPVYAQLPTDPETNDYVGGGNGLSNSDANNQGFSRLSKPGALFLTPEYPAVFLTYAETLFGLAEAVERGFIDGDAETFYKQAITASLNQFGITEAEDIETYLNQDGVKYDASNYKKSIGIQKWISLYGQGLEAFAEWRRLDYPKLTASPATVLDGKMPVRFFYPGTEQSLNGNSYKMAVSNQGDDLLITKLWFDVY